MGGGAKLFLRSHLTKMFHPFLWPGVFFRLDLFFLRFSLLYHSMLMLIRLFLCDDALYKLGKLHAT